MQISFVCEELPKTGMDTYVSPRQEHLGQYLPFYESACLSVLKHVCKYVLDTTFPFTIICLRYNFHRICLVIALQKKVTF